MKKRLLALATALVMIIGLLPAAVLTATAVTPTYQSFSGAPVCNDVTVSTDGYTATIKDTDSTSGTNQVYLYNVFTGMTNPHMTQTIQINNMPVFTGVAISGNAHQASGYFNVMEGPRISIDGAYNEPYVRYSIYRADADGNLKLTIFKNNYANGGAAVTEENSYTVDLNKKLADEFTLTTLWNDHETVSFYCGGSLLGTYEDVTFNRGNYAGLDALFFGYLPHLADTNYAATTEIIVKNMIISDGHTAAAVSNDCTQDILCACGALVSEGNDAHTFDQKVSTAAYCKEGNTFYTSCSVCGISSAGKVGEATFTADDLSGATIVNSAGSAFDVTNKYSAVLSDSYEYGNHGHIDEVTLNSFFKGKTAVHYSQTIQINEMPEFKNMSPYGNYNQFSGYFNVIHRNRRYEPTLQASEINEYLVDYLYTSIYPDASGNLGLHIMTFDYKLDNNKVKIDTSTMKTTDVDLGKKLGDTFRLTTYWDENNVVTFYCDGVKLGSYDNVIAQQGHSGASTDYLRLGYFNAYPNKSTGDVYNVNMTVSGIVSIDGHAAKDDDNCLTAVYCSECGEKTLEAKDAHVAAADDNDCTTATLCSNPGCKYEFVPAAANHTPAEDDGDCTTAINCTVCGKETTAAKEDHTPAEDDGDCTTAIKCTVCGTVTTAAKEDHTPAEDDGDCTTAIKCTVCGTVTTPAAEKHTGGTATCKEKAKCATCGKEYGDFAAHKPGDEGDCVTGFTCTVCDEVVPASGTHTPAADDGDCTTAIKCTVCGKETTAAKEAHTPATDDGDCTTAVKCTVCGKETTAAKEAHTEKVVNAKPATETEKGYTGDKVCSVCGKEIAKGQEIPVLEPAPTEPAPTTPPATEPSTPDAPVVNPDTGDNGTAVYALLLAVSMMAMVALMIPDIRNKLIRK